MEQTREHWLSRNEAAIAMQVSLYRFDQIADEHGLQSRVLPGLKRAKYRESEIFALKSKLDKNLKGGLPNANK